MAKLNACIHILIKVQSFLWRVLHKIHHKINRRRGAAGAEGAAGADFAVTLKLH